MAVIFSIFSKAGARCNMASHLLLEVIYVRTYFASNVLLGTRQPRGFRVVGHPSCLLSIRAEESTML